MISLTYEEFRKFAAISEAVHATVNDMDNSAGYDSLAWLLDEAKCDCKQCKKRRTESG